MKIEKAIELVEDYKMQSAFEATPDFVDALQLLIEAGKREETNRLLSPHYQVGLLPGETED